MSRHSPAAARCQERKPDPSGQALIGRQGAGAGAGIMPGVRRAMLTDGKRFAIEHPGKAARALIKAGPRCAGDRHRQVAGRAQADGGAHPSTAMIINRFCLFRSSEYMFNPFAWAHRPTALADAGCVGLCDRLAQISERSGDHAKSVGRVFPAAGDLARYWPLRHGRGL